MKDNWLKMHDKFGLILRVEMVINNPREFRVRRLRERKGQRQMVWCPMNKGVINLPSYTARVSWLTDGRRARSGVAQIVCCGTDEGPLDENEG